MIKILKNAGAVLAGVLTVIILSIGTDTILESVGIFPPFGQELTTWMLLLALAYRCLFTIAGGFVTAKLSQQTPIRNVKILAIIGVIGGALGVIAGWDLSAHWYPIAIFLTAYPLTILGGKICLKK